MVSSKRPRPRPITLTPALRREYSELFATCVTNPERRGEVARIAGRVVGNRPRYEQVERGTGVPWFVVGAIHNLEASLNFRRHLHNGDPLTARTVHVPRGRPTAGSPPFTWEESALDALRFDGLADLGGWPLTDTLFRLERFNGFGHRRLRTPINTPYLWSFSNHYRRGKFVADGSFDPNAVSEQCGAAVLLKTLSEDGVIAIEPG